MKTQDTKLNLKKQSIVELNSKQLDKINGGCPSLSPTGCICGWVKDKLQELN